MYVCLRLCTVSCIDRNVYKVITIISILKRRIIEVDGFVIEEGAWTNSIIEFDFSGLGEGTHYVKLTVTDLGGNSVSSTVTVVVSLPVIIQYSVIIVLAVAGLIVTGIIIWYLRYR